MDARVLTVEGKDEIEQILDIAPQMIEGHATKDQLMPVLDANQKRLDTFLPDESAPPAATFYVAAKESEILGAAILETPATEFMIKNHPEKARTQIRNHRFVSAFFIRPEYRADGLGRGFLDTVLESELERHQIRWVDGFVDRRNGSEPFYRATGATTLPSSNPLPARPPLWNNEPHPGNHAGHWFYYDLHQRYPIYCSKCKDQLDFFSIAHNGWGQLRCSNGCGE